MHRVGDLVQVAAPERGQPLAASIGESMRREHVRMHQAQAEFVVRVRLGTQRARVDDAAHAIAVFGRVAAGVRLEALDDPLVEHAGGTLQQAQVERLVQRQAVELHERFGRLAAADVRESRQAVARRARAADARP